MFRTRVLVVALVVILILLFAAKRVMHAAADTAAKMPRVGQMAPDFTLNNQDNQPITLSQFHGKWVVLYFYPKDMTSGCTVEAHNFQRDKGRYDADNAVILGVSVQDPKSHAAFCAVEGLNFKLLADTDKKVSTMYGSMIPVVGLSARNTFLINPDGKIVKVWTKVDPETHSDAVLTAIDTAKK
jgi:peroxiredoxin Q/BCP